MLFIPILSYLLCSIFMIFLTQQINKTYEKEAYI